MKRLRGTNFYTLVLRYLPTRVIKFIVDAVSLVFSFALAQYILHMPIEGSFFSDTIFLICSSLVAAYTFGLYRHLWRFTSLYNIQSIFKYCLIVTAFLACWFRFRGTESEHLFKLCLLFTVFSCGSLNLTRIFVRVAFERLQFATNKKIIKVILIGAGKGGELFIRESKKRLHERYQIEGIIDDDPTLWGKKLFGIKVYGPLKDIEKLISFNDIKMVIIAIPSLNKEKILNIIKTTEKLRLQVRMLPSLNDLLMNHQIIPEDITMEDLLGRNNISLDIEEVSACIKDKVILITGAGGSIGSEICRQLISLKPKCIIMVDHSEYNLYKISWALEHDAKYSQFVPILANVGDYNSMQPIFENHAPQIIFHAAAYKHVPLLEKQVTQAISNNFLGTKNVAELASRYRSEKFILISTDKAVNPTNIMGATKRMAEIFCQNLNTDSNTSYITVRFGNVLGSAGSVIPLFKKQLKQGGPLTVTHPEITRFFMSIPEASQLVLQAGSMGRGGEIFVLDMGTPIKISELAERLINLSGKRPYKDIDIVFTGLRPGEKLYEELFYENEDHVITKRKKIFLAHNKISDFKNFLEKTFLLESSLKELDEEKLLEIISHMVPEAKINLSLKSIYGVDHTNDGMAA